MADYLDFFNVYVMGGVELLFQFCFLARILKRKVRLPFLFLFAVCGAFVTQIASYAIILGFVMLVLLLMAGGMLLCHADFKSSLLYAALVTEIMLLCYGIMKHLSSILLPLMPVGVQGETGIVYMLATEILSLLLTGICYSLVCRYFSGEALCTAEQMQYMYLVFIPILMIFVMSEYINALEFDIIMMEGAPSEYLFSHGQLLVIHLLGLASLFCILFTYKKLQQSFRLSTEISLLEQEEHSLNQYVEEAKAHYERTKSFRHDIRNHIAVMKRLLQNGNLEQAVNYMEDMDDMAEKMSFPCSTNNPVADILVGSKLGLAGSMGIRVGCSLLLPYPCGLRDIDICIILSNALDNAIHACKSLAADAERYIHVSGRIQGDFLMMEVENSFHGKGMVKPGTGLSNVKAVAEKYGGAMSVETRGDVFVLHVLLIIPRHPEGISRQMDG